MPLSTLGPRVIGGPGEAPGRFHIPRACATDGRLLYIVDKSARIQALDPTTGECLAWWRTPISELGKPTGLTVAPAPEGVRPPTKPGDAVLWVADTHYNRLLLYPLVASTTDGATPKADHATAVRSMFATGPDESHPPIVFEFGKYGRAPGEFIYVTDVAVLTGPDGRSIERIYVTEYGGNDRLQCFDGAFRPLFQVGSIGDSSSPSNIQMERPQAIEIDSARRELVITDTRNHRLGIFDLDGGLKRWLGSPQNSGKTGFRYPWTLHLLHDGTALCVELGNNRVSRVDLSTGAIESTIGGPGREPGTFSQPWSIAVIGTELFIVDNGNHRAQVFPMPKAHTSDALRRKPIPRDQGTLPSLHSSIDPTAAP
ncbi:MAG: hypothetical protein ACT4PL_07475 [Phycisphaerales bacterium]